MTTGVHVTWKQILSRTIYGDGPYPWEHPLHKPRWVIRLKTSTIFLLFLVFGTFYDINARSFYNIQVCTGYTFVPVHNYILNSHLLFSGHLLNFCGWLLFHSVLLSSSAVKQTVLIRFNSNTSQVLTCTWTLDSFRPSLLFFAIMGMYVLIKGQI